VGTLLTDSALSSKAKVRKAGPRYVRVFRTILN